MITFLGYIYDCIGFESLVSFEPIVGRRVDNFFFYLNAWHHFEKHYRVRTDSYPITRVLNALEASFWIIEHTYNWNPIISTRWIHTLSPIFMTFKII